MVNLPDAASVDTYVANLPPRTQQLIQHLRALVKEVVPEATERMSYGIPTFDLDGTYLVYLAAWKKHISIYPVTSAVDKALRDEIAPYRSGKGTLKFVLSDALPMDLIRQVVEVRKREITTGRRT